MNRRDFLRALTVLPLTTASAHALHRYRGPSAPVVPSVATSNVVQMPGSADAFWDLPRAVYVQQTDTKEALKAVYWQNGQIDPDGYRQLCWLMRDVHRNEAVWMDVRLLDLLYAVQSWVAYYGYREPLMIDSAYRTLHTNQHLEGAARNSMHLYGKAVDFFIPGVPSTYIGELAAQYQAGGVGFYPSRHFTHADTGQIRYWRR